MYLHVYLVALCVLVPLTEAAMTYLYGAPPGGGLYSSAIDVRHSSSSDFESSFPNFEDPVNVVSFDPVSKQVVFDVGGDGDDSSRRLLYGPICQDNARQPPQYLATLSSDTVADPVLGDCMSCKIYGFAMYDSTVYFVFGGMWSKDFNVLTRQVEIRSFSTCDACIMRGRSGQLPDGLTRFATMYNCSKPVAIAHKTVFNTPADLDDSELTPTGTLRVISQGEHLHFFLQIFNSTGGDRSKVYSLDLYHMQHNLGSSSSRSATVLHREPMTGNHFSSTSRALGGVDFLNNVICWTIVDRIHCADFRLQERRIRNRVEVLKPADTAYHRVCSGSEPSATGTVTGVTLIEASGQERIAVFGCYAGSTYPDVGGVGVVMSSNADWSNQNIRRLTTSDHKLGSLFHVTPRHLSRACGWELMPNVCVIPEAKPPPNTGGGGGGGNGGGGNHEGAGGGPNQPGPVSAPDCAFCVAVSSWSVVFGLVLHILMACTHC